MNETFEAKTTDAALLGDMHGPRGTQHRPHNAHDIRHRFTRDYRTTRARLVSRQ